ncbi:MAG: hypothetical protein WB543_21085 [Candidatus Acidiferrum sp.]
MPVIACKDLRVVRLFRKSLLGLFLAFLSGLGGAALHAQTISIKLVDGRNGRPMADKCINVWVGDRAAPQSRPFLETQTDKNGVADLRLTGQGAEINNQNQQLACGLQGVIQPVVKYGDTIAIGSDYMLCQARLPDGSWQALEGFSTKDALQSGIATANTCGKATASPKPGEVILFVRPLTLWEKLKS